MNHGKLSINTKWGKSTHYLYELQPKFRVMESSIRDIVIFGNWAGAWKTIIHSSKSENICLYNLISKTWKTIIHSSKIHDLEQKKQILTVAHIIDPCFIHVSHVRLLEAMLVPYQLLGFQDSSKRQCYSQIPWWWLWWLWTLLLIGAIPVYLIFRHTHLSILYIYIIIYIYIPELDIYIYI